MLEIVHFTQFLWWCNEFVCEDCFRTSFFPEKDGVYWPLNIFNITDLDNGAFEVTIIVWDVRTDRSHEDRPLLAAHTLATSAFPEGFLSTDQAQPLSLKPQVDSCCRRSLQVSHKPQFHSLPGLNLSRPTDL